MNHKIEAQATISCALWTQHVLPSEIAESMILPQILGLQMQPLRPTVHSKPY